MIAVCSPAPPLLQRASDPARPRPAGWLVAGIWLVVLPACERPADEARADPGAAAFESYCAACHGRDGRGVERAGPPLVGSPWVEGPDGRLVRIVLHGVRGPITVGEKTYNLEMPGFGLLLNDAQVAALLSFVRRRHSAHGRMVTADTVARIRSATSERSEYWTVEELLEEP